MSSRLVRLRNVSSIAEIGVAAYKKTRHAHANVRSCCTCNRCLRCAHESRLQHKRLDSSLRAHTHKQTAHTRRTGLDDEEVRALGRAVADARKDEACDRIFVADHANELRAIAHAAASSVVVVVSSSWSARLLCELAWISRLRSNSYFNECFQYDLSLRFCIGPFSQQSNSQKRIMASSATQHLQGLVTRKSASAAPTTHAQYFSHVADAVRVNDDITALRYVSRVVIFARSIHSLILLSDLTHHHLSTCGCA